MGSFTKKSKTITSKLINNSYIVNGQKKVKAISLWDTGATCTCISHDVVKQLGLKPSGNTLILTPSGAKPENIYLIDVILDNNIYVKDIKACGSEIGKQGIDVLIGMDIITKGDFAVSNNKKTFFTFRMPSQEDIDFK